MKEVSNNEVLLYDPCVFAVGHDYQIIFNVLCEGIAWVSVNGYSFYDEVNGLLRSSTLVHRITVPSKLLDTAHEYTVYVKPVLDRTPYYPKTGDTFSRTYLFRGIDGVGDIKIYHLGDAHWLTEEPVRAAGECPDLLILNGDIAESDSLEGIHTIYKIASRITHGTRPVVFARGNHDMRGHMACELMDYIGTDKGNTFFTFRLGPVWGIVLDCGEDKVDESIEYGSVISCHRFRERQIEFLRNVIKHRLNEYDADGVEYRIGICHIPFTLDLGESKVFKIENEIYNEWSLLLRETGINLLLCAHQHTAFTVEPEDERNYRGQYCPVVVGSAIKQASDKSYLFTGTALTLHGGEMTVAFTDSDGGRRGTRTYRV